MKNSVLLLTAIAICLTIPSCAKIDTTKAIANVQCHHVDGSVYFNKEVYRYVVYDEDNIEVYDTTGVKHTLLNSNCTIKDYK
jgi:hypothetical protein